jgi:glutamyl/glutaminyl-tRNA synthetase
VGPGTTRVDDLVRGEVVFENVEVEDWVMLRSDGTPTYNFVVVCDDVDMRISHVVRGEEHLVNTPKQVLLYQAFGAAPPAFAHLPLMLGTDRKKLSKRTGDTALQDYRDKGFPPEAVVNFLCLQGWALDGATELFGVGELVEHFELRDVGKAGGVFDLEKFLWIAGEYIRRDSLARVAERALPFVAGAGLADPDALRARWDWYLAAVASEKERIRTYGELPARIAYLFGGDEAVPYAPEAEAAARRHAERLETLRAYLEWLRPRLSDPPDAARLREATKAWIGERGLKMPQLFQPLRCALTGAPSGVDLFDAMALLGARATLRRVEVALERLS